ncbi:MAG: DUF4129 domain-containing protein [Neisseria sp.]|nr:DUF4129 domain-containing protein [Neisseria sp.]
MTQTPNRFRFRRRTPWEAADLGVRLIAERFGFYVALWLAAMLPLYLVVTLLFWNNPLYAFYALWWLKPLFEAGLVMVLSRQVLGETPDFSGSLKQTWQLMIRPRIIGDLTWRRLSLRRSVILPITVLERVKGAHHARRRLEIGRNNSMQSGWLTLFGVHFEMILFYGLLMIIGWVLLRDLTSELTPPGEFNLKLRSLGNYIEWLKRDERNWLWHLCNALYLLVLSFWQPFFVAMGFTLYVQARTESEAWDIRLAFRRLAERLGKNISMILGAIWLSGSLLFSAPSHAATPPDAAQVERIREQTVGSPPFVHPVTQKRYCFRRCEAPAPSAPFNPSKGISVPQWQQFLYWFFGLSAAAVALYILWRWQRQATWSHGQETLPERMFGLDVREDSLPPSVAATAMSLFGSDPRAALALLYRALLVQLLRREHLLFRDSSTEGEILRLVTRERPDLTELSGGITRAWVRMAYAHRTPDTATMQALCDAYAARFETPATVKEQAL